jgi:hypothetical protein
MAPHLLIGVRMLTRLQIFGGGGQQNGLIIGLP